MTVHGDAVNHAAKACGEQGRVALPSRGIDPCHDGSGPAGRSFSGASLQQSRKVAIGVRARAHRCKFNQERFRASLAARTVMAKRESIGPRILCEHQHFTETELDEGFDFAGEIESGMNGSVSSRSASNTDACTAGVSEVYRHHPAGSACAPGGTARAMMVVRKRGRNP